MKSWFDNVEIAETWHGSDLCLSVNMKPEPHPVTGIVEPHRWVWMIEDADPVKIPGYRLLLLNAARDKHEVPH